MDLNGCYYLKKKRFYNYRKLLINYVTGQSCRDN